MAAIAIVAGARHDLLTLTRLLSRPDDLVDVVGQDDLRVALPQL